MVGTTVHHYQVREKLGAGGMGVVYRAEDTRLGRTVAIKFLNLERGPADASVRFMQEARTASALNHPHICTVHDVGEHNGIPYLVMEYLHGTTLEDQLREERLEARAAVRIALQVADALEAAHANGIVHRDIKPANIFLTGDNQVKLLDFGIAKRAESERSDPADAATELTQWGSVLGTVCYMSPEQALGQTVDWRTDLFSFGVVLYEMLMGRRPFREATSPAIIDAIVHKQPEGLSRGNRELDAALRRVVRKLLEKSPQKRYQSGAELRADLSKAEARLVSGRPGSFRVPLRMVAVASLAALIGWGAWWALGPVLGPSPELAAGLAGKDFNPRPIVAILRPTTLGADPSLDEISLGIAYTLATGLSAARSLTMIAPTATLALQKEGKDALQIARELGANYVVTGTIQRVGDKLRVDLNLLRGNSIVWGEGSSGSQKDPFSIQQELVDKLSYALRLVLSENDRRKLMALPTRNREAFAEYTQARAFLERPDQRENLDHAIDLFESALVKDPEFSLARAGLGEAFWAKYERDKDPEWTRRARQETEEALALDPGQAGVRRSLAVIQIGSGQPDLAVEELRRAIEIEPSNDDGYRLQGEALLALGKTEEAVRAFQRAIALRPNFWGNHRALGLAYFSKGRYTEAVQVFERITQLQPDLNLGYQYLGVANHALGDLEKAKLNYQEALKRAPNAAAFANLGTIFYREGDFARAARQYEESLRISPKSAVNLRNLGDTYQRMGLPAKAEALYVQALELTRDQLGVNPNDARLLAMAALLEAKLHRPLEAARHADQALQRAPKDGQVLYRRAVVYAFAGQTEAAVRFLRSAIKEGFSPSEAALDDDLSSLRSRPDFRTLVAENRSKEGLQ